MRQKIWKAATRNHPEGTILTRWLIVVRAALFPLDSFYWHMDRSRGYDWLTDIWTIDGMRFSGSGMRMMADAQGETYKITRAGDCVTFERIT